MRSATARRVTIGLLIVGPVAFAVWDYDVYEYVSNDATISIVMRDAEMAWPPLIAVVCFAAGICAGHWWWPLKPRTLSPGVGPVDNVTLIPIVSPAPQSWWTRFLAVGVAARTKALVGSFNWTGGPIHWDVTKASIAGVQVGAVLAALLAVLHGIAVNTPAIVEKLTGVGIGPKAIGYVTAFGAACATLAATLGKAAALFTQGPVITTDPTDPAPHDGVVSKAAVTS